MTFNHYRRRCEDTYELPPIAFCLDCKESSRVTYEDFGFDHWGLDGRNACTEDIRPVCGICGSTEVEV